ncbi:MAG: vWA domain-containing protein, partial [Myxococcota bacterium]|nr:vWA domain-containing protein [Myxococcota bacterium]
MVAVLCTAFPTAASGQTQVKPYIMILLDTSSSMLYDPRNTEVAPITGSETLGDGSNDDPYRAGWGRCCPGVDTAYDADALPDDSRLFIAKEALRDIVSGYGDVQFGLMRYRADECAIGWGQDANVIVFPAYQANMNSGLGATVTQSSPTFPIPPFLAGTRQLDLITYLGFNCRTGVAPNRVCGIRETGGGLCNTAGPGGDVLVPFAEENTNQILEWIDNTERFSSNPPPPTTGARRCAATTITNRELRASGFTPLARSIDSARTYFAGVRPGDPYRDCRGYFLVVITDGDDTCDGNPVQAVTDLRTAGVRSYTIGFAFMSATLNQMAAAGGTGRATAFNAAGKDDLAAAFTQIVDDTVLTEICDGIDNDCDTLVDEGFVKYCNLRAVPPIITRTLCADPGEACNFVDDNCDTRVDEGVQNACGGCGPVPPEECNGRDDDCDGETDEGLICTHCVPEVCDGRDNDCDGETDEGLGTRACGSNIGQCRYGSQACVGGAWGACTGGTGPSAETCDNRDNDCDGMIDGLTRTCGTNVGVCVLGTQICTAGAWGTCAGGYNGTTEICNLLDDDCDGLTDEGNPGGGAPCGSAVGECRPGTVRCVAGTLVCDGGVLPVPEICDGRDNDCDGETDEGNPGGGATCYTGPPGTRGVGICEDGVERCVGGRLVCAGERTPAAEDCNGLDDDCDGATDEDLPTTACGSSVGECRPGIRRCVAGAWVCEGETPPRPEVCNLLDDDCDGATDEGNPGGGVPCGWNPAAPETWDLGECEPGIYRCLSGTLVCEGVIGPVREICNGLDDDCNGWTDDGLAIGEPCGEARGECEPGRLRCIDGAVRCVGGVGPAPETCDCADNDCDDMIDEDVVCPGASVCLDCSCALPCEPTNEFSCPMELCCECGRTGDPMDCYCVRCGCGGGAACGTCETCENEGGVERCVPVACGECERCDPATNACAPLCDRVSCPPPTECLCGECTAGCYVTECPPGRRCVGGECVPDPCHPVHCAPPHFCREGLCYEPCELDDVCPTGEICFDGECVENDCHGVTCDPGVECVGGVCQGGPGTPCETVECLQPLVCRGGDCTEHECHYVRCADGYHCERGTCVTDTDPGEPGLDAGPGDGGDDVARDTPGGDAAGGAGSHVLATGTGGC